eukprot:Awhi_evm1s14121
MSANLEACVSFIVARNKFSSVDIFSLLLTNKFFHAKVLRHIENVLLEGNESFSQEKQKSHKQSNDVLVSKSYKVFNRLKKFCNSSLRLNSVWRRASASKLEVYFKDVPSITYISNFKNLYSLTIINLHSLQSIEELSPLTRLTQLSIRIEKENDFFEPLRNFTNLKSLSINASTIRHLSALQSLNKVTCLDLSQNFQLRNIDAIGVLVQLKSLNLGQCVKLVTLPALQLLTKLELLSLENCDSLAHLEDLVFLKDLKHLDIINCKQLWDIKPLMYLTSLTFLQLTYMGFPDIAEDVNQFGLTPSTYEPWSSLVNLEELRVYFKNSMPTLRSHDGYRRLSDFVSRCESLNSIKLQKLQGLKNSKLKRLFLYGGPKIQEGTNTPWNNLNYLEEFEVFQYPNIYSLEPMKHLTNLKKLKLPYLHNCD